MIILFTQLLSWDNVPGRNMARSQRSEGVIVQRSSGIRASGEDETSARAQSQVRHIRRDDCRSAIRHKAEFSREIQPSIIT